MILVKDTKTTKDKLKSFMNTSGMYTEDEIKNCNIESIKTASKELHKKNIRITVEEVTKKIALCNVEGNRVGIVFYF